MKIKYLHFYGRLIPVVELPDYSDLGIVMDDVAIHLGLVNNLREVVDQAIYEPKLLAHIVQVDTKNGVEDRIVIPLSKTNRWLSSIPPHFINKDIYFEQEVIDPDSGEVKIEVANQAETYDIYLGDLVAVLYSQWSNGAPKHAKYALGSLWKTAHMNLQSVLGRFCEYSEQKGVDYFPENLHEGIKNVLLTVLPGEVYDFPETCRGIDLYRRALAEDYVARHLNHAIATDRDPYETLTILDSELITIFHEVASSLLISIDHWSKAQ